MKKSHFVLLALTVLLAGCGTPPNTSNNTRTYYDSLALASPEAAVESFISAYQNSDFQTVYLILSPRAQRTWQENYTLLNWSLIFRVETQDQARSILEDTAIAQGKFEHSGETSYEFDELMLAAQKHDRLLVDLSGNTQIQGTESARDTVGNPATDVIVTSGKYDSDLIFRTVQAPSGKWRVYQVILPGGNVDNVPWAVPEIAYNDETDTTLLPLSTSAAGESWLQYTNLAYGFSFRYPASWNLTEVRNFVFLTQDTERLTIGFRRITEEPSYSSSEGETLGEEAAVKSGSSGTTISITR